MKAITPFIIISLLTSHVFAQDSGNASSGDVTTPVKKPDATPVAIIAQKDVIVRPTVNVRESHISPKYPKIAERVHFDGWVTLSFVVNEKGKATDITVTDSYPKVIFDQSAIDAVRKLSYFPGTRNGQPADIRMSVRIKYDYSDHNRAFTSHKPKIVLNKVKNVLPDYPAAAITNSINGWVIVSFTVTKTGTVTKVKRLDSYPEHVFDQAAIDAVTQWLYEPPTNHGKAVSQDDAVILSFNRFPAESKSDSTGTTTEQ